MFLVNSFFGERFMTGCTDSDIDKAKTMIHYGNYMEALVLLKEGIHDVQGMETWYKLALIASGLSCQSQRTWQLHDEILRRFPMTALMCLARGMRPGVSIEIAIHWLEKAVRMQDDTDPYSYYILGSRYSLAYMDEAAASAYSNCISLEPHFVMAFYYRGICARRLGKIHHAFSNTLEYYESPAQFHERILEKTLLRDMRKIRQDCIRAQRAM
jgi:tetratricopeptide (TPR) repeat protein